MNFLTAVTLYASTVFGFTNHLLALAVIPLYLRRKTVLQYSKKDIAFFSMLLIIVMLTVINNTFGFFISEKLSPPYFVFTLFSFCFYKLVGKKVLQWLFLFIIIELVCAFIQYYMGISTFFSSSQQYFEFANDALYYRKSAGLSSSSSVLSYKVLIGFFIVDLIFQSGKLRLLCYLMLSAGLIVTFNRTAIIAAIAFLLISNFHYLKSLFFSYRRIYLLPILLTIAFATIPIIFGFFINEFSRGNVNSGVDLSYRTIVWLHYIDFISDNTFLGNYSYKYISNLSVAGYGQHSFHAHNSFLMILSSHGLLIGPLFLLLVFSQISRSNVKYIIPIFIYSFAQYGIFWGLSFLDVLFAYFLMGNRKVSSNREGIV